VESHHVRTDILDVTILIRDVLNTKQEYNATYKVQFNTQRRPLVSNLFSVHVTTPISETGYVYQILFGGIKITVFCDVTPCSLVDRYLHL